MPDPVWLPEVLRAAKLNTDVFPGAMNRGHGDFGDIWGVMDHHTGASGTSGPGSIANHPSLGLASQLYLGRDGKFTVCGVGIAWHAGNGSYPGLPKNNANPFTIGIEADNNGTEGWGQAQYWSYVKGNAAILNKLGHSPKSSIRSIGHKEWAGASQGKWDPGGMNMDKFRADIANTMAELKGVAPATPIIENQIDRVAHFSPWLGKREFAGERPCKDGEGRYADFEGGSIYWHPRVGAIAVPTHVYEVWERLKWEQGLLGYPKGFHTVVTDVGDVQVFEGGTVYRRYGTPGFVTHGMIGDRYFAENGHKGHLGWPTSDEYRHGEVIVQDFEHGQLLSDLNGTVQVKRGDTIYSPPGR